MNPNAAPIPKRMPGQPPAQRPAAAPPAKRKAKASAPKAKAAAALADPGSKARWTFGPVTMPGELASKSNSRQIVKIGNMTRLIKSKDARHYMQNFKQLFYRQDRIPFEGSVRMLAVCYYRNRVRDLDVALLQDCLQEGDLKKLGAGIIKNDRQVVEIHAIRMIDKDNPRVVFTLEEIMLGDPWQKRLPAEGAE